MREVTWMKSPIGIVLTLALCATLSQAQSDTHEREVHRESERNTEYHNNASDYTFKSGPATPPASTAGYHDYRKDTLPTYVPSSTSAPTTEDVGFGRILITPTNLSSHEAFALHQRLADNGDAPEMVWVGQVSVDGVTYKHPTTGVLTVLYEKNPALALKYYIRASPTIPYAEYKWGKVLFDGLAGPADRAEGLKHMQNAAARGEKLATKALTERRLPLTGSLPETSNAEPLKTPTN